MNQENSDPVSDFLYTSNFALLGLHEAGFFLHFLLKCTKKGGQFLHFLLQLAEKEGKTDQAAAALGNEVYFSSILALF